MELKIFDTPEQLARFTGKIFVDAIGRRPDIVLGLATGESPVQTYRYIYEACKRGEISLKDVRTYNLDEYVGLPREDKNSYYTFMHEQFFDHTDIREENVHLLDGNAADMQKECADYDARIAEAGGIDLQLLGVGRNGHIGFNEPSDHFSKGSFKVKLTESTIEANSRFFDKNPMPRWALTMGIGLIMRAKRIVLIATGAAKAEAVAAMFGEKVTPACPASILEFHPNALVCTDREAAKLLRR